MKIKRIFRENFVGKVYNFHCLPNENYFSCGILVHNCYKDNSDSPPTNMSLDVYRRIISKFTRNLEQVALGITDVNANPDFIEILRWSRSAGIVPNYTLTGIGLTDEVVQATSELCGAVAVSVYPWTKSLAYDTIFRLTEAGMSQVNIHLMLSEQTKDFVYEVLEDSLVEERLHRLNAVVFLSVKPKGRAKGKFTPVSLEGFKELMSFCNRCQIKYGFDSCSAQKYEAAVKASDFSDEVKKYALSLSESCESDLFSSYINVNGELWHCSFTEGEDKFFPVNVEKVDDFLRDIWYNPAVVDFRSRLLSGSVEGCRKCPVFSEINI